MDEAFAALRAEKWPAVSERACAAIALDLEHEEASRLLIAAGRILDAGTPPEVPAPSATPADGCPSRRFGRRGR